MLPLQSLHGTKSDYAVHNTSYAQRSCKFMTASELLKSSEVTCRCQLFLKSSPVKCDQVDGGQLGVILGSSRVTFVYRSNSQVYSVRYNTLAVFNAKVTGWIIG